MHTRALPFVALLSFFWGTNAVASRFGIGEFDPFLFIALRLAIASLCFGLIVALLQGGLPRDLQLWKKAGLSGLLGVAIPLPTFILSLQYHSSGVATLYVTSYPVMLIIAAHFFLPDEHLSRNKVVGVCLALGGALFLALRGESGLADVGRANPLGFILVVLGLAAEVINTLYVRLHMKDTDPVQVTAMRLIVAALAVLFVSFFMADYSLAGVTSTGYASLLYAAFVGALGGQFLAFYIQRSYGATAFSLTSFLVPLVATLFGALLLGEVVSWAFAVAVLLIGSGLYLINRVA